MIFLKKIIFSLFIFILLHSCSTLPGITQGPKERNSKILTDTQYSIEDVGIEIVNINTLNENDFNLLKKNNIEELDLEIKKFDSIYNYRYEYILGAADIVSINLTDTDDIDNSYEIDPDGMIDLQFIGKVKINDYTVDEAQNFLKLVLGDFYRNPDLQISIDEYNSSKVYIVGAVRNQITINLDQKPIRLLEAAIQANFNPNAADKVLGTKGFLRRDNKVYKINLNNTFSSVDDKENFYLKKDDVIFIDRNSESIHVFGEVTKPGEYYPNRNYSLTELISTSGLNQLTANAKKVYVIREDFSNFLKVKVYQLDIKNPVNLIVGRKFLLQPKDIVFIPPTEIVKWNRVISLLLPQTDLFNSYNPIIQRGVKKDGNVTE